MVPVKIHLVLRGCEKWVYTQLSREQATVWEQLCDRQCLTAFPSCFSEVIFREPNKDRPRQRLGNCPCSSCVSTSPSSQPPNPDDSHLKSSGNCIFQSTHYSVPGTGFPKRWVQISGTRQLFPTVLFPVLPDTEPACAPRPSLQAGGNTGLTGGSMWCCAPPPHLAHKAYPDVVIGTEPWRWQSLVLRLLLRWELIINTSLCSWWKFAWRALMPW